MAKCLVCFLAVMTVSAASLRAEILQPTDPDVARGITLVEAGEFDGGILVLEPAAKRLTGEGSRQKDLARAYAYLAIAYLGLNHEQTAKAKFLEALDADKDLKLGAEQFSPRIIDLFEQARREALQRQAASDAPPPSEKRERGSVKTPLMIGAGVAAAGVVVAAAAGSGGTPPTTLDMETVSVALTLNGLTGGTQSCSTGLFFVVRATNTHRSPVQLTRLDLMFTTNSPGCLSHSAETAGVIPTQFEVTSLPAGASNVQIRQVDLAGDLCDAPRGTPGCLWQARATLATNVGSFSADLQFVTSR